MDRMNGHIWAESEPEHGSSISFLVPIFSLQDLIAPILMHHDRSVDTLAVLEVGVLATQLNHGFTNCRSGSHAPWRTVAAVHASDLDVLLPKLRSEADGESFLVVARPMRRRRVLVKRFRNN